MDLRVSRKALAATGQNPTHAKIEAILELAQPVFDEASDGNALGLTAGQRLVLAVRYMEMEVNSGGFDCYFRYCGGNTAEDALAGLKELGATKFAEVLSKAMALFPGGCPAKDIDVREKEVDEVQEAHPGALGELDSAFYDCYEGEEPLGKALVAFVRSEPGEFFVD